MGVDPYYARSCVNDLSPSPCWARSSAYSISHAVIRAHRTSHAALRVLRVRVQC